MSARRSLRTCGSTTCAVTRAGPKAAAFAARSRPYTAVPGGFSREQYSSTAVVRWEYRPGSTLFVVWTQSRHDGAGSQGSRSMGGDFRDLFNLHPDNTFLVKASYWLNW